MLGGLVRYLATAESKNFQPPDDVPAEWKNRKKLGRRERRPLLFARGQRDFAAWLEDLSLAAG